MRALVTRWIGSALGVILAAHALGTEAVAQTAQVPEISPASISAGLALLAGGVLVLRSRGRSK